jgi:hypothetical protein
MRTLRNVTFIVLCALLYWAPTPAQASSFHCWADYAHTMGPCDNLDHYQGGCNDCELDAWYWAIQFCDQKNRTMLEYFCSPSHFEFVCADVWCPE